MLVVSGLLNIAYFFPIVYAAFFRSSAAFPERNEASPSLLMPLLFTAFVSILLGIWPNAGVHLWDLAQGVGGMVE